MLQSVLLSQAKQLHFEQKYLNEDIFLIIQYLKSQHFHL